MKLSNKYFSLSTWMLPLWLALVLKLAHQIHKTILRDPWSDIGGYIQIAKNMTSLYDTQMREPVLIWLVKATMWVFPNTILGLAIVGALSYLVMCVLWDRCLTLFKVDPWVNFFVLAVFVMNGYLQEEFTGFVRDFLTILSVVIVVMALIVPNACRTENRRLAFLTFGVLLLVGSRLTALFPAVFLCGWMAIRQKKPLLLLVPTLATALLLAPYLVYCSQKYGDALYSVTFHGNNWKGHVGIDAPLTGQTKILEFIQVILGTKQIWTMLANGFYVLYFKLGNHLRLYSGVNNPLNYLLYLAGFVLVLRTSYWYVPFIPLLFINITLVGLDIPGVNTPHRYYALATPFLTAVHCIGIVAALRYGLSFTRNFVAKKYSLPAPIDASN